MKVLQTLVVICLFARVGTSCGGTAIGNGRNVTVAESGDVPKALQSAALTCSVVSKARTGVDTSTIGCNLIDAEEKKVDATANGIALSYSVVNPSAQVDVVVVPQEYTDRLYNVIAVLKGPDTLSTNTFADSFKLAAVATYGSSGSKTFSSSTPKAFSSSVSIANWSVVNPSGDRYAVDLKTGLKWKPYDAKEYTWEQASKMCADLTYAGITTWRLPNLSEFHVAAGDGIYHATTLSTLEFLSYGRVFWVNIPADKKLPAGVFEEADLYNFTNSLDQTIERHDIGSRQPAICVSE